MHKKTSPLPAPTAIDRTVKQTLHLLDTTFISARDALCRGEYALWLGSGISRERVAALNGVLSKLIEFLRVRATDDENCPFRKALSQIIDLANPSEVERSRISLAQSSTAWPDLGIILKRLAEKYSGVLSIIVEGQAQPDYLLWEAADFVNTFANQEPDAEHLCVGILALEGVIADVVTANWDGLLEAAIRELGHTLDVYRICVTGNDFRGAATAAKLLKFHGCAIRAIENEALYRPLLIARHPQIIDWQNNPNFAAVKHALIQVAATRRTLMVGMSAQDVNIQGLFGAARALSAWSWNDAAPPHMFAEQDLLPGQRAILEISYQGDFHPNQGAITARSCVQVFGKPLFTALVLQVISAKCSALIRSANAPNFQSHDYETLDAGILRLRDLAAEGAATDILGFVRKFVSHVSQVKSMLQEGEWSPGTPRPYRPISTRHDVQNDSNISATGQREAASALAILGLGEISGDWKLSLGNLLTNQAGAIKVSSPSGDRRVLLVANSNADLSLFNGGAYKEDESDVILLHSTPIVAPRQRSPSRSLGRTGKRQATRLDLSAVLANATDVADLKLRFRQGTSI